jgi:hypothetical protein
MRRLLNGKSRRKYPTMSAKKRWNPGRRRVRSSSRSQASVHAVEGRPCCRHLSLPSPCVTDDAFADSNSSARRYVYARNVGDGINPFERAGGLNKLARMEIQLFLHKDQNAFLAKIKNSDLKAYGEAKPLFAQEEVQYYASKSSKYRHFTITEGNTLLFAGTFIDTNDRRVQLSMNQSVIDMKVY